MLALLPLTAALLLPHRAHRCPATPRCGPLRCCDGLDFVVELEEPMLDEEISAPPPAAPAAPAPPAPPAVPDGEWVISEEGGVHKLKVGVAGKVMEFESGLMAKLSSGAVSVKVGETMVFCAACFERKADVVPIDFTPLRVDYMERSSGAGRTKGGYIKRDGRPSQHETLVSRLIDRPIRPLITPGWSLETQLTAYVLSYDTVHLPDVMAVTAASASLCLSEVPFEKPIAAVRVGMLPPEEGEEGPGTFVVNPTREQAAASKFDLVLAGTAEAVLMIEGFADFLPEEQILEGLELGLAAVKTIATALDEWRGVVGKPKFTTGVREKPAGLRAEFERLGVTEKLKDALCGSGGVGGAEESLKQEREEAVSIVQQAVISRLTGGKASTLKLEDEEAVGELLDKADPDDDEGAEVVVADEADVALEEKEAGIPPTPAVATAQAAAAPAAQYDIADVRSELKRSACIALREVVADTGTRQDGRGTTDVRNIDVQMACLPNMVHGSALFTRGETQSLATVTLGDASMAERYEDLNGEQSKPFYLQYTFPPFSVGEVGRNGAPGRREVGHGNLAERALRPAVPGEDVFPYVVRAESLITESCGSSSMASVCSCCLAMRAAGVPVERMVAGVAMGMLLDETGGGGEPIVLTDILGSEDALGTMDFKVAGDEQGVTAFQLDIKCEGLSLPLMRTALLQAREARLHILGVMKAASPAPAASLPPTVPRMFKTTIDPDKVGKVIGRGGETINAIIAETGVDNIALDKPNKGDVTITAFTDEAIAAARARIEAICGSDDGGQGREPPKPLPDIPAGTVYAGCEVKTVVPFGVFVALKGEDVEGLDGFCHISQLSSSYVGSMEDVELAEGDTIDVEVTEVNEQKRQVRVKCTSELTIRASERPPRGGGGGRGRGGGRGGGRGRAPR